MDMRMRLVRWIIGTMRVLMMLIVHVGVRVGHRLVDVFMFVAFCKVQPDT